MGIKKVIQLTSYYGFYFGLAITIYSAMSEIAYVITGKGKLSVMTFLFPLLLLGVTILIKKAGTTDEK